MLESFWETMVEVPGELHRRIEDRDAAALRQKAHWAMGAAVSAAAVELAQVLQALEALALDNDWDAIAKLSKDIEPAFDDVKRYILGV